MTELPPLPPRMRSRPLDERGYPISYVTFVADDGKPDFRIVDQDAQLRCLRQRRCGMCGAPMGRHVYFIGGELSQANRLFHDPPMHRECAIFALQACPHLANSKGRYNAVRPYPAGAGLHVVEVACASDAKAQWFALLHTTSFGTIMIQAGPWLDVERWQDGALIDRA